MSLDDFGSLLGLKRGVVSQYIRNISTPKIETLILICNEFKISLDDLVCKDLEELKSDTKVVTVNEVSNKYVEMLEQSLKDKEKIIAHYESLLQIDEKRA
jgi:transcriptional regulator with XRE-family HTH domain